MGRRIFCWRLPQLVLNLAPVWSSAVAAPSIFPRRVCGWVICGRGAAPPASAASIRRIHIPGNMYRKARTRWRHRGRAGRRRDALGNQLVVVGQTLPWPGLRRASCRGSDTCARRIPVAAYGCCAPHRTPRHLGRGCRAWHVRPARPASVFAFTIQPRSPALPCGACPLAVSTASMHLTRPTPLLSLHIRSARPASTLRSARLVVLQRSQTTKTRAVRPNLR